MCLFFRVYPVQIIVEGGGQRKPNGDRRSPGGVFLNILKSRCTKAEIKFMWSEQSRRQRLRKRARNSERKGPAAQ